MVEELVVAMLMKYINNTATASKNACLRQAPGRLLVGAAQKNQTCPSVEYHQIKINQ